MTRSERRRAGRAVRRRRRELARVEQCARALGFELMPWQVEIMAAALRGDRVYWISGRRGGLTVVRQAVEAVRRG